MTDIPHPQSLLLHPLVENEKPDVDLPEELRKRIINNYNTLYSNLDLRLLLPYLVEKGVLMEAHYEELCCEISSGKLFDAKYHFLQILRTRGRTAYMWFCQSLKEKSEQLFLYELLVDEDLEEDIRELVGSDDRETSFVNPMPDDLMEYRLPSPAQASTIPSVPPQGATAAHYLKTEPFPVQESQESITYSQTVPKHLEYTENDTDSFKTAKDEETLQKRLDDFEIVQPEQCQAEEETQCKQLYDSENEGEIEEDFGGAVAKSNTVFSEDESKPKWIRELRNYQLELAKPGVEGKNYIICATTGSGKTRAAGYVIYEHLQKMREKGRVVFFAPTVALVRQQYEQFKKWFPSPNFQVDYLVGDMESKPVLEVMIEKNQISCMTPAVFESALKDGRLEGLHKTTMLVFDECHHTDRDAVYNKIMGRYVDQKLKNEPNLPQIVGITASLGVGEARADYDAMEFVLKKCANLDAQEIAVVREHREELRKYVNEPEEFMEKIPERKDDPFSIKIIALMKDIEKWIKTLKPTEQMSDEFDFPEAKHTQIYLSYLSNIMWKVKDLPPIRKQDRMDVIGCLEYLTAYHKCLTMHREARSKDALNLLQDMLQMRRDRVMNGDKMEMWLEKNYNDAWDCLNSISQNRQYDNPKLKGLKKHILAAFQSEPESYAILFTKTKVSTEALKNWVNEDPDMKYLKAIRLTGSSSEETAGMTSRHQQHIVNHFKQGKSRLLIATSVAEEGLDIKACNIVFRYNYSTNEVGRVQSKGRARQMDSKFVTVTSLDNEDSEQREKMNLYREGLMKQAIEKIHLLDRDMYERKIRLHQITASKERRMKALLKESKMRNKSTEVFLLCCFKCNQNVCKSDELVVFHDSFHTVTNPDFDGKIKVQPHKRPQKFGLMVKMHKIYCIKCKWDWGLIVSYREQVQIPVVKAGAFAYFKFSNGRKELVSGPAHKKWDDAPCAFREITENEILSTFCGRNYKPNHN